MLGPGHSTTCQLGRLFRRCRATPSHTCQYCARSFCDDHAHFVEGYEAVCARKRCAAKHEDLQRHIDYKDTARGRNRAGLCGQPDCTAVHPTNQCSMCQSVFCRDHLRDRVYPVQEGWVKVDKHVSVCAWCWARRKLWQRR